MRLRTGCRCPSARRARNFLTRRSETKTSTTSSTSGDDDEDNDNGEMETRRHSCAMRSDFRKRAKEVYERYSTELKKRFKWLSPTLFVDALRQDLAE